jgi:hypothetical protein
VLREYGSHQPVSKTICQQRYVTPYEQLDMILGTKDKERGYDVYDKSKAYIK